MLVVEGVTVEFHGCELRELDTEAAAIGEPDEDDRMLQPGPSVEVVTGATGWYGGDAATYEAVALAHRAVEDGRRRYLAAVADLRPSRTELLAILREATVLARALTP